MGKRNRTRKINISYYSLKLMKQILRAPIFLTFSIVLPPKLEEVRQSPAPEKMVGKGKKKRVEMVRLLFFFFLKKINYKFVTSATNKMPSQHIYLKTHKPT